MRLTVKANNVNGSTISAISSNKYDVSQYEYIYFFMEGPTGNPDYTQWFDASVTYSNS